MDIRLVRQFFILIKSFHSISLYHKGLYTIRLSLVQENGLQSKIYGFPIIKKKKMEGDHGLSEIQSDKCFFYSEEVQILFNEQICDLKDGCVFHMQYDCEENITYVDFQLLKRQNKSVNNDLSSRQIVGKNRLYINHEKSRNNPSSCYQKIYFNANEYYSCMYVFVQSIQIGKRLRMYNYQMPGYWSMGQKQKNKFIKNKHKILQNGQYKLRHKLFQYLSTQEVYKTFITDKIQQYRKVKNWYVELIMQIKLDYENSIIINDQNENNIDKLNRQQQLTPINLDYIVTDSKGSLAQQLSKKYGVYTFSQLYGIIYQESIIIGMHIKHVWNQCIKLMLRMQPQILRIKVNESHKKNTQIISKYFEQMQQDVGNVKWSQLIHKHIANRKKILKNITFYLQPLKMHPMIIVKKQIYEKNLLIRETQTKYSILIVLIHGYQGNQHDMKRIKCHISGFCRFTFCIVNTIQLLMNEDIQTLSRAASNQILQFMRQRPSFSRINIIGFSLGGIIARGVLKHLHQYQEKLNLLITFASPHLGVTLLSGCIINTGLAILNNIAKIKNVRQLSHKSTKQMEQKKYLQVLSECKSLQWLNGMVVVGTEEDSLVPIQSSLIDYNGEDAVLRLIQKNIVDKVKIDRFNVWFDFQETFIDKITGRKRHVAFLESDVFLQYFFSQYWKKL